MKSARHPGDNRHYGISIAEKTRQGVLLCSKTNFGVVKLRRDLVRLRRKSYHYAAFREICRMEPSKFGHV